MKAARIAGMSEARHYERAPITEAVIDLRVELPPEVSLDTLRSFTAYEELGYTKRSNIAAVTFQGTVSTEPEVVAEAHADHVHNGYRYDRSDEKQIIQARLD